MQQISLRDLAAAAQRKPSQLVAVAALGGIVEPETFRQLLELGLEVIDLEAADGTRRRYVDAAELAAFLLAPLLGEAPAALPVN